LGSAAAEDARQHGLRRTAVHNDEDGRVEIGREAANENAERLDGAR
jgi:hypothetical protein